MTPDEAVAQGKTVYAIGDPASGPSWGMWYGPTPYLRDCTDQVGRPGSTIFAFHEHGERPIFRWVNDQWVRDTPDNPFSDTEPATLTTLEQLAGHQVIGVSIYRSDHPDYAEWKHLVVTAHLDNGDCVTLGIEDYFDPNLNQYYKLVP